MSEHESEQPWASLAAYRFQSSASVSAGATPNTHSFTATPARLVFQRSCNYASCTTISVCPHTMPSGHAAV